MILSDSTLRQKLQSKVNVIAHYNKDNLNTSALREPPQNAKPPSPKVNPA